MSSLTYRTCSNCVNWYPASLYPDEKTGTLTATCIVQDKRKRGGETCSSHLRNPSKKEQP